jgi:hypothetical protein
VFKSVMPAVCLFPYHVFFFLVSNSRFDDVHAIGELYTLEHGLSVSVLVLYFIRYVKFIL